MLESLVHFLYQKEMLLQMRGYVVFWWPRWNSPRFLRQGKGLRAFHLASFCRPQVEHKWNRYRLVPPAYHRWDTWGTAVFTEVEQRNLRQGKG